MLTRLQLIPPRYLAVAGFVGTGLGVAFVRTVPNASELALQDGWFVVLGNFLASTGIVVLGLMGLAWAGLSLIVAPLAKSLLNLSQTGAGAVAWIERFYRRPDPPVSGQVRASAPPDGYWNPLEGEFLQPGTGLRDNICIFAQMWAVPISIMLVTLGLSVANWLS